MKALEVYAATPEQRALEAARAQDRTASAIEEAARRLDAGLRRARVWAVAEPPTPHQRALYRSNFLGLAVGALRSYEAEMQKLGVK